MSLTLIQSCRFPVIDDAKMESNNIMIFYTDPPINRNTEIISYIKYKRYSAGAIIFSRCKIFQFLHFKKKKKMILKWKIRIMLTFNTVGWSVWLHKNHMCLHTHMIIMKSLKQSILKNCTIYQSYKKIAIWK